MRGATIERESENKLKQMRAEGTDNERRGKHFQLLGEVSDSTKWH